MLGKYKSLLLNRPKFRNVFTDESDKSRRLLVLRQSLPRSEAPTPHPDPPPNLDSSLASLLSSPDSGVMLSTHTVSSGYTDLTGEQQRRCLLL